MMSLCYPKRQCSIFLHLKYCDANVMQFKCKFEEKTGLRVSTEKTEDDRETSEL